MNEELLTEAHVKSLMTREKVQAFLDAGDPTASAGECGNAGKCALAQYLVNTLELDQKKYRVSCYRVIEVLRLDLDENDESSLLRFRTPDDLFRFITLFDQGMDDTKTYAEAAELLRSVYI